MRFVIYCLVMLAAGSAKAEGGADSSAELLTMFKGARYQEALTALQANPQPENATYHYNLGTVHLKLGAAGPSLAHLEKANRLSRHDPEIQHNLQLARSEISRVIGKEKLDPASTGIERLADRISIDEVRGAIGLLALLLSAVWLRAYLKTRSLRRMALQSASLLLLVALSITLSLYAAQRYTELHPPAVLLEAQSVRSGPGNGYLELARLEAGVKLRITNQKAVLEEGTSAAAPITWLQVRFSPQEIGWVRASSMLLL